MTCEIQTTRWSKAHLVEGVKYAVKSGCPFDQAYEFGVYRGESLALIENLFYAYQKHLDRTFGFDSFQGLPAEALGVDRFYLFEPGMFADVTHLWPTRNARYIKGWFNELRPAHVREYGMKPAAFVHIDGDLYISAVDALTFLFENKLIQPGTVVAYDEFKSTPDLEAGGESRAHEEMTLKYGVVWKEFFRNVYFDHVECWQNCFVVEAIGSDKPHHGIYGVA